MNVVRRFLKKEVEKLEKARFSNEYKKDKWRQNFHLMPPIGWLNDPNGLCYQNNEYNIFFQYAPFDTKGGLGFWGHYKTKDFINYKYMGVAIYPDDKHDCHGVYSGSALVEDKNTYLYYTGNVKLDGDYDYISAGREANTMLIEMDENRNFSYKKCLMEMKDYPKWITNHIRDPKVWKEDDTYYMIQGVRRNTTPNHTGAVILFKSKDKINWEYLSFITHKEEFGYMWECPDLFNIDGQNILITCPQGVERVEALYENIYLSGYFTVDGDYTKEDLLVDNFNILDCGFDFYAPQTFLDEDNNRVLIGWMGLPDIEKEYQNDVVDWQHCLTIPRKLSFKNNKLYQEPYKKLENLRENEISIEDIKNTNSYEAIININNSNNFKVIISEGLVLKYENSKFSLEFINNIGLGRSKRSCHLEKLENIRIYVDTSSVEVFVNNGERVFTTRFYPNISSLEINGEMSYTIYKLGSFNISSIYN